MGIMGMTRYRDTSTERKGCWLHRGGTLGGRAAASDYGMRNGLSARGPARGSGSASALPIDMATVAAITRMRLTLNAR